MRDNKKTLLLLGASEDQEFIIQTAKGMGVYTLVIDGNSHSPGFHQADEYAVVSTRDIAAIFSFLEQYLKTGKKIHGVTVMGSDIPHVVAKVAKYLNLPHIPLKSAEQTTHKFHMKRVLQAANIPVPKFYRVTNYEEALQKFKALNDCMVLKPVDRSGARGVFLIDSPELIEKCFLAAQAEAFSNDVMVEEYILGPQVSTESIIIDGQVFTPGFVDRNYEHLERFSPQIIENGGWQPSKINEGLRQQVETLITKAAKVFDIKNGVIKGDVVIAQDGPKLIEIATRLSGGDFSESLVPLGTGINYVKTAISLALGEKPSHLELEPRYTQAVANRYFFPQPGRLLAIKGIEKVIAKNFVKKLKFWYEPGDIIPTITSHGERFGVFVVVADDRQELEERIQWVYDSISIEIDESKKVTTLPSACKFSNEKNQKLNTEF